jgi:hypothetical protein
MKIQKKSLSLLLPILLISNLLASAAPTLLHGADSDPFIKTWRTFNGNGNSDYQLQISGRSQGYSVNYNGPSNEFYQSDSCNATSSATIDCPQNVHLSRNDERHSMTVNSTSGSQLFYDPQYPPVLSSVIGVWQASVKNSGKTTYFIKVMPGNSSSEYIINTESQGSDGCFRAENNVYYVTPQTDGTQLFKANEWGKEYSFTFNPIKNQITQGELGEYDAFYAGYCVRIFYNSEVKAVFNKI